MNDETKIIKLYLDPKEGLTGLDTFHKKLKQKGININRNKLKEILSGIESYSLNKTLRKNFPTRKVISNDVFDQLQMDLVEMDVPSGAPAKDNDGVRYLLTIIDVLSKYAWVIPLKDKKGKTIAAAIEPIIKQTKPNKIQVDHGGEFYNRDVKQLMKKYSINMFSTYSDKKASIVERFNRTLKQRMGRLFDATNSNRYIDDLDDLVENYNNTVHRTIKMKPVDAIKKENFEKLVTNFMMKIPKYNEPKLKVGDYVRIPKWKTPFSKEFIGSWTMEIFKVKDVHPTLPVTYSLVDLMDDEVTGKFYEQELQKVSEDIMNDSFKVEKVIRTRTRNGVREGLVKWLGYPDKFNSWEPMENIMDIQGNR